jgi:quercetin dioxygenase-like cupin family protein
MNEKWKYIRFEDSELADLGNGFFGADLLKAEGIELTFIKGEEASGHGFHRHEDLNEILIFLDGECVFTLDQTEIEVKGGSILYIPHEVDHKVRYKKESSVLRLKIP